MCLIRQYNPHTWELRATGLRVSTGEKLYNPDRHMLTFRKELNGPIMLSFSAC